MTLKKLKNVPRNEETQTHVNRLRPTDGPYEEIVTKGFICNYYKYVKELRENERLNRVRDGEFYQINKNYTKEPNRNFITEVYHIFKKDI